MLLKKLPVNSQIEKNINLKLSLNCNSFLVYSLACLLLLSIFLSVETEKQISVFEFSPEQLLETNFIAECFNLIWKSEFDPLRAIAGVSQFIAYLRLLTLGAAL